MLSLRHVERVVLPALKKAGLPTTTRRGALAALTDGLADLPIGGPQSKPDVPMCTFAHFLNLVWACLLEYLDSCTSSAAPDWTPELALCQSVLSTEMKGIVMDTDESLDFDAWVLSVQKTLRRFLKVDVPPCLVKHVMAEAGMPFHLELTPASALHFLRSRWCSKLVGPALAAQIKRQILQEISEMPVGLFAEADLGLQVRQDLVNTLSSQVEETDLAADAEPAKKRSRTSIAIDATMTNKTKQVLYMLQNRMVTMRVHDSVKGAGELLQGLSGGALSPEVLDKAAGELVNRTTLNRHLLVLDGAVDRCMSDRLMDMRDIGRLAGAALATDESPPSQPRFRGLRFQITILYIGTFVDLAEWRTCDDPPIIKSTCLADVMHCPGKRGVDVSRIVEKQLARVGLNCYDVVSCTGDGGGENEGWEVDGRECGCVVGERGCVCGVWRVMQPKPIGCRWAMAHRARPAKTAAPAIPDAHSALRQRTHPVFLPYTPRSYRRPLLLREPESWLRAAQVPATHILENLRCGHPCCRPQVQGPGRLPDGRRHLGAPEGVGH